MAGFVCADVLAVVLCLGVAWRSAGLHLDCYRCFSAPVLASLLAGLLVNLGYRLSLDAGASLGWSVLTWGCAGLAAYLGAMAAQGIRPLRVIRLR